MGILDARQRLQMANGQIHHVDVIAHAGAILSRVVIAEHRQLVEPTYRNLADEGQQVVGNAVGVFADKAGFMGTDRIEVAQQHYGPARIGLGQIAQDFLNHQLGTTIGVRNNFV